MSDTLKDEILSTNAIYEPDTLSRDEASNEYILRIPTSDTTLRLSFPDLYPDTVPKILGSGSSGSHARKGTATEVVALAQDVLAECFRPGEPCIFELLEQLIPLLPQEIQDGPSSKGDSPANEAASAELAEDEDMAANVQPEWILSDVITEKKSVFIARAARVTHPDEAKVFIKHLVGADKKVAKATHNITAWRISVSRDAENIVYQDCDDDGESAAGGRVLHLLQTMDVWNVCVVVSRWFGGQLLGPDRFRCISNVARDALVKGGFDKSSSAKSKRKQ